MYFVPLNEELEDRVRYMTIHIIDSCLKKYKKLYFIMFFLMNCVQKQD